MALTRREVLLGAAASAVPLPVDLPKRKWTYIQQPAVYDIAGCECGNSDPEWSEFEGMLWCAKCQKDFKPAHNGIFDGPIPVHGMAMMGISLDRVNLETGEVEVFDG